ncbi:lipopolysaccharide biosynthesis protein [Microbacterium sp. KNMS]
MTGDTISRGLRGGGATALSQVVGVVIQMASVVILSRMLAPTDFGLIAMVAVFVSIGELVRDFGLPTAALQARELSHAQASNMFWGNVVLGASAAALLVLSGPALVLFYNEPRLGAIVPAMAGVLFLNGLQAQTQVHLARAMRFGTLALTSVGASLVGLAFAVVAAALGWGYWALVIQLVAASAALLVARWIASRWIPGLPHRGHGTKALLQVGGNFGAAQLLTRIATNIDTIAIGAQWGASDLGYYNRAFQLLNIPISRVLGPLTQVVVPTLNRARREGQSPMGLLLKIQFALGSALVWVFLVTAATAESLIPLVLGSQWTPAVVYFQILAIGGCFNVLSFVSYWVFIVEDQSRELLLYNLVTKTLVIVLVIAASFWGVEYVAWAYSVGLGLSWPINLMWLSKTAKMDGWSFFRNGLRMLFAGLGAYVVTSVVLAGVDGANDWLSLILGATTATASYVLLLLVVPGGRRESAQSIRVLKRMVRK